MCSSTKHVCVIYFQLEVNKKREAELQKLRLELEETRIQSQNHETNLRKKQQDAVSEISEQLDRAQKAKQKYPISLCRIMYYCFKLESLIYSLKHI